MISSSLLHNILWVSLPQFIHSLHCWWAFGLFPVWVNYTLCCFAHFICAFWCPDATGGEPGSPALQADSLPPEPYHWVTGKPRQPWEGFPNSGEHSRAQERGRKSFCWSPGTTSNPCPWQINQFEVFQPSKTVWILVCKTKWGPCLWLRILRGGFSPST